MGPEEFDYTLPPELIAQYPLERRDGSRLMVLFSDIKEYLRSGDLLVLNDTRVIPARLLGRKATGGKVEVLLLRRRDEEGKGQYDHGPSGHGPRVWECLVRPSKGLKRGAEIEFNGAPSSPVLKVRLLTRAPHGIWTCELRTERSRTERSWTAWDVDEAIEAIGRMPLPPYIRRGAGDLDEDRYQTVFARHQGAVATPTAGLHFTTELIEEIKEMGVEVHHITLHTGPATFMPVRTKDISEHRVPGENFNIEPPVFEAIRKAREQRRRVIAVGSTATRALETVFMDGFEGARGEGETGLFIYPRFEFRVISGLLTNFHLPQSSLIMLVSAFAGRDKVVGAYREAVREGYRFYSYGDAMLII
jgi:S-adenosylmethionine:tRNA ribosyltransferase-isomerase